MQGSVTVFRSIGDLVFDATFEESHTSELEVTDNPTETGVVVSDHAFMKPLRVSVTAGVSDVLLPSGNPDYGGGEGRSQTAFELLSALQKEAEPFDVQTGLRVYENMVCTSIRTSQNKDSSGIFYFQAELREVLIVSTESASYPPVKAGATQQQASKPVNKGEQQGKQVGSSQGKNPNNGTGASQSSSSRAAGSALHAITGGIK